MAGWFDILMGDPKGQQELAQQQLQTQLQGISLQQEADVKTAELKYNPERIAEQRKTIIAVLIFLTVGSILVFIALRFLR